MNVEYSSPRRHWSLYYYLFSILDDNSRIWDLRRLREMELTPTIGLNLAATLWEMGWQETDNVIDPKMDYAQYD